MTQPEFQESDPDPVKGETPEPGEEPSQEKRPSIFAAWYETLAHLGLGETLGRVVTTAIFLVLIIAIVWILRSFYKDTSVGGTSRGALAAEPTAAGPLSASALPVLDLAVSSTGVRRFANLHTIIPDRPRKEIVYYDVVEGDTIIGIAGK
jgi:hypothetical protein